jgi:pimeloyl-ACP methyl ester carboxylesterase
MKVLLLLAAAFFQSFGSPYLIHQPSTQNFIPRYSSCTGLKNEVYDWRGQNIRYIASGPKDSKHTVLLIHGLFVNADTWRHTIAELGKAGYRTYALDLLGSGYSSKPLPCSLEAQLLNGERGRFYETADETSSNDCKKQSPVRENVLLGTASGGRRIAKQLELRHPLNSCYNFYTWAEQINDFTHDIIFQGRDRWDDGSPKKTSLIANSKGCLVALQACLDKPEYYNGVCAIDPTYREMHNSEMNFPFVKKPMTKRFQRLLREKGHCLYNFIARRPGIIKNMLKEPYYNHAAIDDELVTAIAEPLNLPYTSDVVFDELSYSTGPLFEQLLQDINDSTNSDERQLIWVVYGKKDPWLHPKRVESLQTTSFSQHDSKPVVDEVIPVAGAGHCPHDEKPEVVGPIMLDFLQKCKSSECSST